MWLLFTFCFGLFLSVEGNVFKELNHLIPKTDLCFLELIMCDDVKAHLIPLDKFEYQFYTDIKSLEDFCRRNEAFIKCTKESRMICKATPHSRDSAKLLESRSFAEAFCSPGSLWQKLYLENARCVNMFSAAANDICTHKTHDLFKVAPATEILLFCRSTIAMRECLVRIIHKACGIIAGDLINRIVRYSNGDDFLCNTLEDETIEMLQKSWFTPAKNYASKNYQIIHLFQSGNTPKPIQAPPTDTYSTIKFKRPIAGKIPVTTEISQLDSYLEDKMDFTTETNPTTEYSVTQFPFTIISNDKSSERVSDTPSSYHLEDIYAFKNFTSFKLYEILGIGEFYLGCGTATVLWITDMKLKNVYCGWVNGKGTHELFDCTIHLDEACMLSASKIAEADKASHKTMLVVFKLENDNYQEIATMKVKYFEPERKAYTLLDMVDANHQKRKQIN